MFKCEMALLLLSFSMACPAADPGTRGWRGDGTGGFGADNPPTQWDAKTGVLWVTPMPGFSNAMPLLVAGKFFVCSEPDLLICVQAADGKILWQKSNAFLESLSAEERAAAEAEQKKALPVQAQVAELEKKLREVKNKLKVAGADKEQLDKEVTGLQAEIKALKDQLKPLERFALPKKHDVNGYSTPTPVTDGQHVYALFGTGMAAAYTLEGERRWLRQIEVPTKGWGHSTSPLFAGGKLLVHIKDMVGLNPETGQEVWRTPAASMWGTPVLARIGEEEVAICPGGEVIRAKDGKLLASKIHRLEYNAPVVQDGVVYGIDGAGGKANKLPAQAADTLQFEALWSNKPKNDRYYSSPAVKDGLIYAITRGRALSVFDAKDGQLVYEKDLKELKGEAYPSITAAGKYLYVGVDGGQMLVLEGGREFKEVARNQLEPFRSSPVFVGNRLYLRTSKNFYCIGAAQP